MKIIKVMLVLAFSALISILSGSAWAVQKVDLYSSSQLLPVGVKHQAINQAIYSGLKEVIVRITGSQSYADEVYLEQLKPLVADLLESSGFESSKLTLTDRLGDAVAAQHFVMKFNSEKILNIVRSQGWPVWSGSRPELFMWGTWVNESGSSPRDGVLVTSDNVSQFTFEMEKSAQQRGVPILWPWGDLQDLQQSLPSRLWLADDSANDWLFELYQADKISRFVLKQTKQGWTLNFNLTNIDVAGGTQKIQSTSLASLAQIWVDILAENLAGQHRIDRTAVNQTVLFQVSGIDSLKKHKKVQRFLSNLTIVNNSTLLSQRGDNLVFKLTTPASILQFKQGLAVESFLRLKTDVQVFDDNLSYVFVGE
jgi:hypothetical protein